MLRLPRLIALLLWIFLSTIAVKLATQSGVAQRFSPAAPARFSLISERDPMLTLHGPFRFHPGDDPRWADPGFDASSWALVPGDRSWEQLGYKDLRGSAWYRFRIILPPGSDPYGLSLPSIDDAYQVFADGKLLLTVGRLPPRPRRYATLPRVLDLRTGNRAAATDTSIAIRIWAEPQAGAGDSPGLLGSLTVGRSDLLRARLAGDEGVRQWFGIEWALIGWFFLVSSVIAFAMYVAETGREKSAEDSGLWYSLLCLGQSGFHFLRWWEHLHTYPVHLLQREEACFFGLFLIACPLFCRKLLRTASPASLRYTTFAACVWIAVSVFSGTIAWLTPSRTSVVQLGLTTFIYLATSLFVLQDALKRCVEARILLVPLLLWFGALLLDGTLETLGLLGCASAHSVLAHLQITAPVPLRLEDLAATLFLLTVPAFPIYRFARTRDEGQRFASEFDAARSVQQALVPQTLPILPGLAISTAYHPAEQVGGDFFQILQLRSGAMLLVIGDVSGKGLPAALTVSLVVGTLRTLADYSAPPAELLAGLNRRLHDRGAGFTTCLALHFSEDRAVLVLANAGHLAPYLNGRELHTEANLPLGLDPQIVFAETTYALREGDHLTVLTDGVPEAMHGRALFGFERTAELSSQPAAQIAAAARSFGQCDDITVLTVDVTPLPA